MMRVIVTGATGSLGQALLVRLKQEKYSVLGLGRSQHKIDHLKSQGFEMKQCDITNLQQVNDCISGGDIVIHCAAFAAPFGSKKKFFDTNVEGTKNIFKAAKKSSVSRIVAISSASVFDGSSHERPHGDQTPNVQFRPRHPYGASKFDGNKFIHYTTREGLNSNNVQSIAEDQDGMIWIGTKDHGLYKYNAEEGTYSNYSYDPKNKLGLSSAYINALFHDDYNVLWIGTAQGGINKLDFTQKQFINYTNNSSFVFYNYIRE